MDPAAGDAKSVGGLAARLASARRPREIHVALLDFLRSMTSMNSFFVASFETATQLRRCEFAFSDGAERDVAVLPAVALNENHSSQAIREGRTVLARDFQRVRAKVEHVDVGLEVDPRIPKVAVVAPMLAHDRTLGYLEIQSCEAQAFSERDVLMLETAAGLAALALENLNLQERESRRLQSAEERLAASHAVARELVRRMLGSLTRRSHLPAEALRDLGRELGRSVHAKNLEDALAAYASMGLGDVVRHEDPDALYRFVAHDLIEHLPHAKRPTCYLTLGFLEGAVEAITGHRALGTELECRSVSHEKCRFVVATRGAPLARR